MWGAELASLASEIFVVYGQIVAIMNPFTALNNYITLTEGMEKEEAHEVLKHAMIVVFALGLLFIFAGRAILSFYHLSIASLEFGGGVLLMYIALDMLSGQPKSRAIEGREIAVVPLATPMIVGPGTMTLLISLGATTNIAVTVIAFTLSALTVAATLYAAGLLQRVLGRNGIRAMARFMSLIIASIAAQMMYSAVREWASSIAHILSG
jgi:multiple antibiotic resistance protein